MRSLATRADEPEWMDGDDVDPADFAACLADLAEVNTVTLGRPPTLAFVGRAARRAERGRALTILDVGFGDGDMLRAIHRWAARRTRPVRLIGIDLNPRSAPAARARTPAAMAIDYRTGDAFALPEQEPVDIVLSSLVAHHMADAEVVRFLRWMEGRARLGWFVNDLHRHPVAYHGFAAMAAVRRWHRFVRHDGPLSVARGFRRADWRRLLAQAGVEGATIRWHFPFRYGVGRLRCA